MSDLLLRKKTYQKLKSLRISLPNLLTKYNREVMSVRIVRLRNGEDVICDLYEVTTKEDPEKAIAFQLKDPYSVYTEVDPILDTSSEGEIQKVSSPQLSFVPWAPLSRHNTIMLKLEEVISAYETFDEVINKYNELTGATNGRGDGTSTAGSTDASGGGSNDARGIESDFVEAKIGVPVGESDGAGRGAKPVN
tara:strand:+ start:895 stop:1473 length:579 start_codon:yes stop_codon:yes gene_type:complete